MVIRSRYQSKAYLRPDSKRCKIFLKEVFLDMGEMFQNLDRVLEQVSREKNISKDILIDAIESAFLAAARKKWGYLGELESHYNREKGEIELFQFKTVVENVTDPNVEMTLDEARKLDPEAEVGDSIGVKMNPEVFGRIAAQTAKQVIIQKVREAEQCKVYEEFADREGELITGRISRIDKGDVIVDLGRTEAILPKDEQVPSERYKVGERVQGLLIRVLKPGKGVQQQLIISRKDPRLVAKLFSMEVPEIADGVVEIKSIARDPGYRTKIAVSSRDSDVDPIGACVGMRGQRVQSIVQELRGEKIDIVQWDEDPARFVCNAIAPADVVKVIVKERERKMEVVVPDDQLSLAIGKKGQNVRLAAELCSWSIDVLSESKVEELARRYQEALKRLLGISGDASFVFYSYGYRGIEEISVTPLEEFLKVPGISEEELKMIHSKAHELVSSGVTTADVVAEIAKEEEAAAKEKGSSAPSEDMLKPESLEGEMVDKTNEEKIV